MTRQVQVGVVNHRAGYELFVGWTIAEVNRKVYEYVKKWWDSFCGDAEMPEDHEKAIFDYFMAALNKESFAIVEDELPIDWVAAG